MRIYISTLSDEPQYFNYERSKDSWLHGTVAEVDDEPSNAPVKLDISVYKNQELVVMKAKLRGSVLLHCSRCAEDYLLPTPSDFQCFFSKDKTFSDEDGLRSGHLANKDPEEGSIFYLDKEYIELHDVIKEQLLIKVPYQPLCTEDCQGLCMTCGQNKNTAPCQCHRLHRGTLAKALSQSLFKLDRS